MNTTIYITRHSEPLKIKKMKQNDSEQLCNEKWPLSVNGENKAKKLSELVELSNIDFVISSHYVRAISTAKYIALKNNLDILINENFGERIFGVNQSETPPDFGIRQFNEENYKLGNGESQAEVRGRMYKALMNILNHNRGKRIFISSHATAMSFLFQIWCDISLEDSISKINFNNKTFFEKKWEAPELFKLVFNENNDLISIDSIKTE